MRLTPRKARREGAKTRAGLSFETRGICMCTVKRSQPRVHAVCERVLLSLSLSLSFSRVAVA